METPALGIALWGLGVFTLLGLVFGFALVLMMRFRPEGLLPSARRRRELRATDETAAAESQQLFDVRSGT